MTLLLIVFLLVVFLSVDGLNVTAVPYGVIALKRGEAKVREKSYDITIIRRHPDSILNSLGPLERELRDLLFKLRPHRPMLAEMFSARLMLLHRRNFNVQFDDADHQRQKRGLIDAIGSISKSLFGTATTADVNELRNKIEEIVADNIAFQNTVKDTIVCVNDIAKHQVEQSEKINTLVSHVNYFHQTLDAVLKVYNNLSSSLYFSEMSDGIENGLSYIESVHTQINKYENHFQYQKDLAEIGHLTESLIGAKRLKRLLQRLGISFPLKYLYQTAKVTLMKLESNLLAFHFSVPVLDSESYTAWDISSVPFLVRRIPHIIKPELSHVGIGLKSGRIIELEHCEFENPIICPAPILYDNFQCLEGILNQEPQKMKTCEIQRVDDHALKVKRLSPRDLLLYSEGETLTERCKLAPASTVNVEAGTYIVNVKTDCFVESSQGWQFTYYKTFNHVVNITDDVVCLKNLNLSLEEFDTGNDDLLKPNITENVKKLMEYHLKELSIEKTKTESFPKSPAFYAPYILSGCIILCVVVFLSVWLYRKRMRKAHSNKGSKEEVHEPELIELVDKPRETAVEMPVSSSPDKE